MPPRRPPIATSVVALLLLLALAVPAHAQPQERSGDPRGRYIVTLVDDADPEEVARDQERAGGVERGHVYRRVLNGFAMKATEAALRRFEQDPRVARVEVDGVVTTASTVQHAPPSWGVDRLDEGVLGKANVLDGQYRYSRDGAGVDVYVLDTGIRANHDDFGGRVKGGLTTINDGNGTEDCNGHGTHVAGTAGGALYGVAKAVALVPVRVLACDGRGTVEHLIAGLDWVVAQDGRRVANLSLVLNGKNDALDTAVAGAVAEGVTVVVAAGNASVDACGISPAREAAALTVGATGEGTEDGAALEVDRRARYSNYGSCLDVFAPGTDITSAGHSGPRWSSAKSSGTSMATPHVAGAAALHLSAFPDATPAAVSQAIISAATPGVVSDAKSGSPNLLLRAIATPTAPREPDAVEGDRQVTVGWSAPASDGGAEITGYRLTASNGTTTTTAATARSATISSLTNGEEHTFHVVALNAVGTGDRSSVVTATPAAVPGAPQVVAAEAGDTTVRASWEPPASDGGSAIEGYTVVAEPDGATVQAGPDDREALVSGLVNGREYTLRVHASNRMGDGPSADSDPVTPATVPGAPQRVTAFPGDATATVHWVAPDSDGGAEITSYTVRSDEAALEQVVAGADRSLEVTGLTNGSSYSFTVTAHNRVGEGQRSQPSEPAQPAATADSPSAPTEVTATAGHARALVSWAPSDDPGSAPLTSYLVSAWVDGGFTGREEQVEADETSVELTDLSNDVPHTFRVRAINADGHSSSLSPHSEEVTPRNTLPGAPTDVSAEPGDRLAELTWSPPAWDGGSTITGYRVTATRTADGWTEAREAEETSLVFDGLQNGSGYTFVVEATNAEGTGLPSDPSDPVVPRTVPDAPGSVSTKPGDGSAVITWTAPASDGGSTITGYQVQLSGGGSTVTSPVLAASARTRSFAELANGTTYTATVWAINAAGPGPTRTATVTPRTVPDAPTGVTAVEGNGSAKVSWTAPAWDGGAAILDHTVIARRSDGKTVTVDKVSSPHTVTGLDNGWSYTFRVRARNVAGLGGASAASDAVTPRTVPGAPRNVAASPGDASAVVSWAAPSSDGGAKITSYTVTASPGGQRATTTGATSVTVPGLTNGTSSTFTVTATNVAGTGTASSPSAAVIPLRPLPAALDGDPATTTRITDSAPSALAVSISQRRFADADGTSEGPPARHVVLSRDDAFPDSLAGASLTADGPLLYTGSDALPSATAAELRRILPGGGTVYLLGGEVAISSRVANQVAALRSPGYRVVRLAGDSRIETALRVADEVRRLRGGSEVLVARADSPADNPTAAWADSVTGGAYGAVVGTPVILTPSTLGSDGQLHPAVAEWVRRDAPTRSVVLGGTAAVGDPVALRFPGVVRVSGAERAATAKEVAVRLWGAKPSGTRRHLVINGFTPLGWAHGLAAAGLAADHRAPLLLVNQDLVPTATAELMSACGAPQVDTLLVGPGSAITDPVARELERIDGAAC